MELVLSIVKLLDYLLKPLHTDKYWEGIIRQVLDILSRHESYTNYFERAKMRHMAHGSDLSGGE